jgi:hypothetical protein
VSKTDKARAEIAATLPSGENIDAIESAQVKVGDGAKRLAKDIAASAAVSALTGFGAMRITIAPQVWVVVTDTRLLMFNDTRNARKPVGELVFEAPRAASALTEKAGVLTEVTVSDADTGAAVARLNFGMRRKAAAAVMRAAQ